MSCTILSSKTMCKLNILNTNREDYKTIHKLSLYSVCYKLHKAFHIHTHILYIYLCVCVREKECVCVCVCVFVPITYMNNVNN